MLPGDGLHFVEVAGQRAGVEFGQRRAGGLIEGSAVHLFVAPGDPLAGGVEPLAEDVEPDAVDPAVAGHKLADLRDGDFPERGVQGLIPGRPIGAEHDRAALPIEHRPAVELRVAVADGVVVVDQPQVAALAGAGHVADEVAARLEAGGLRVVEDEAVDPLVVEDQVGGPRLAEIGHPAVGVHPVAEPLFPLPDAIRFQRLLDVAGHDGQGGRTVPGLVGHRLGRVGGVGAVNESSRGKGHGGKHAQGQDEACWNVDRSTHGRRTPD